MVSGAGALIAQPPVAHAETARAVRHLQPRQLTSGLTCRAHPRLRRVTGLDLSSFNLAFVGVPGGPMLQLYACR